MKRKNSFVVTGITSLFLIFCVLCLVILSLLSLGTSRSDYKMSRQTMDLTASYYEACSRASSLCLEAEDFLWNSFSQSSDQDEYFKLVENFSHDDWILDKDTLQFSLEIPFSQTQALCIRLNILYPEADSHTCMEIDAWETMLIGSWNPDTKQPIYQGDS